MADEFTKSISRELNIEEDIIKKFEDENIDKDAFLLLEERHLEKYIPTLGQRLKLVKKMKYFQNFSIETTSSDSTISLESLPTNILDQILMPPPAPIILDFPEESTATASPAKISKLDYTLEELLNETNTGQCILNIYQKNGSLDRQCRDKLTDIIISKELNANPNEKISRNRFSELASKIKKIFPSENESTYFFVNKYKTNTGSPRTLGKGKLFSKYYAIRDKFKKSGLITNAPTESVKEDNQIIDEKDYNDVLNWLKNNTEPFSTVIDNWKLTFNARKIHLKNSYGGKISDYFLEYPSLKLNNGYVLLEEDFNLMYPDTALSLYGGWKTFSEKVAELASNHKPLKRMYMHYWT